MAKIMIIEDDPALRKQVSEVLENYAYEVVASTNFQTIEQELKKETPDLVLLDINLPYFDGNYYCKMFRRHSNVPIVITSARNSDLDQILSMELGADDYLVKPFSMTVLLAKVNAIMRRLYGEYAVKKEESMIHMKELTLDTHKFQLSYEQKVEELSKTEYRLMKQFMQCPDKVIEREQLLEAIWEDEDFIDDNTLTVNVTRLKGKLKSLGITEAIRTKRGVGYLFDSKEVQ